LQAFITSDSDLLIGLERERSPAIAVLVCYGPGALIWSGFAMLAIMLAIAHSWHQLSTGQRAPMPEMKKFRRNPHFPDLRTALRGHAVILRRGSPIMPAAMGFMPSQWPPGWPTWTITLFSLQRFSLGRVSFGGSAALARRCLWGILATALGAEIALLVV